VKKQPTFFNCEKKDQEKMSTFACEECEKATALWRCAECNQALCGICDANLHAKGTRKSHKRTPFAQPTMRAVAPEAVKLTIPTKPATVEEASKLPNTKQIDRTSAYMFGDPQDETNKLLKQMDFIYGDLKNEMDTVGTGKELERSCPTCGLQVKKEGTVINAMGRQFHPECFRCAYCNVIFGETPFVEQDGKPYCPADHRKLFSTKCYVCGEYIKSQVVRALGHNYHAEHFTCVICKKPLSNNFLEHQGEPYCPEDYATRFVPKCPVCLKPIMGGYVDANGKRMHQECFACTTCHRSLLNSKAFSLNDKPYCEQHYHAANNTLCGSCNQPVTGKAITAFGRAFHPGCFNCTVCKVPLSNAFY